MNGGRDAGQRHLAVIELRRRMAQREADDHDADDGNAARTRTEESVGACMATSIDDDATATGLQ